MENLKALIYGRELTTYQKGLAFQEFEKLLKDQEEFAILKAEFEQYKRESIKWSVEDFTELEKEGWQISDENAQDALEDMIHHHDCNYGIDWNSVDHFYELHGEQVAPGTESWRKYIQE